MRLFALYPALIAFLPVAALAQVGQAKPIAPPAAAGVVVTAQAKSDPNRTVCRKVGTTGSRLGGSRICRTAAEWTLINADDRRDIEKMQANRYKDNQ